MIGLRDSLKILQLCKHQTPLHNENFKRYREVSPCESNCIKTVKKECFDAPKKLVIMRGDSSHAKIIKSFLYSHYWPREPSVTSVWMDINSPYIAHKTDCFATSGDRLLAFEKVGNHGECKMIGFAVSNKIFPWMIDELEEWAHHTDSTSEQNRMYLCAHFLKSPNLFKKYHVDYIYEVEVLATAGEVAGLGVGTALLQTALDHAADTRHPLVQVIAVSYYTALICEKVGLKKDWEMQYKDFLDRNGNQVYFPRAPHHSIGIYTRYQDPKVMRPFPCQTS